jgi:hypothetical protein
MIWSVCVVDACGRHVPTAQQGQALHIDALFLEAPRMQGMECCSADAQRREKIRHFRTIARIGGTPYREQEGKGGCLYGVLFRKGVFGG